MKPIEVAIGIVCRRQQVLICQRRRQDHLGGYWEFPGGKIEPGETVEQCLTRELREELDIQADPVAALPLIEYSYPDRLVRLFPLLCNHKSGEPKPLGCERAIWIPHSELGNFPFPPANAPLIEHLVKHFAADTPDTHP